MKLKYKTQAIKGITYAFFDKPYWNSDKKRCDHEREYIGKIVDGKLVPNKTYTLQLQLQKAQKSSTSKKRGPVPTDICLRKFYGATYLLDAIAEKTGIASDLKTCFGDLSDEILSLAYYLICEESQPMYRFDKWANLHHHPCGKTLSSQRISELFDVLCQEDAKMQYFKRQAKRRMESEYLAFDTTSISTYSRVIKQAKYGINKEKDSLPQLNLLLLFGEGSRLPVYYRKLAGNIVDVKMVRNLLTDVDFLELKKLNLVMDRGFYSEANINDMMRLHHKFLIGAKLSLNIIKRCLQASQATFVTRQNYDSTTGLYIKTFMEEWDYVEKRQRKGDTVKEKRRVYIHLYYNDMHCMDERMRFNRLLDTCEEELRSGRRNTDHETLYQRYFSVHETPKRGIKISYNEEAIALAQKNFGYFTLMSNDIKDPIDALQIYRCKDVVEKSFGNLKERLNMRRMNVSSEERFEGKLFVQFIALSILSYIKKKMDDQGLFKNYTMQSLLDELDVIEYYQQPNKSHHLSEITTKQQRLYELMGVPAPA